MALNDDEEAGPNVIETAIDAGKEIAALSIVKGHADETLAPFAVIDNEIVSLEEYLDDPRRKRSRVTIRDVESFIAYLKRFAEPHTVVFANLPNFVFTGVVDYHEEGTSGRAQWCDHVVTFTLAKTPEWIRWNDSNKKKMNQWEMAQFLEDNVPNIAQPPGALIVEIARSLDAKKSITFASSVRLESGEHQLTYHETINGTAKGGSVQIPESFTLGIKPFEGSDAYQLDARFRYRIEGGGALALWYDLLRPERVLEDAFREAQKKIDDAIDAPVFAGSADCKSI